jgi:hypothetical protein
VSGQNLLWGIALVGAGVFVAVYGTLLFQFALGAIGFGLGFLLAMKVLEGQSETVRIVSAFIAGFVVAFAFYALVGFALWIAGAVLGLILGIAVLGLIDIFGSRPGDVFSLVVAVAAAALVAFFGRRLGDNLLLLAMAAGGSFMILYGTQVLFHSRFETVTTDPSSSLYQRLSLFLFVVIFAISGLAQRNERRLRRAVRI